MIPDVPREALLAALDRFDRELRQAPEWAAWDEGLPHKFAIEHEGRRYPVKQIIAMASGVERDAFSGGETANGYLRRRGFRVTPLQEVDRRQVWWVNQGDTYELGREGAFLRAPQEGSQGTPLHWRLVADVHKDDIVVHYLDGQIRALSRALADAAAVPAGFGEARERAHWDTPGWRVALDIHEFTRPIPLERVAGPLRTLAIDQGPLAASGRVKQGYLWRFSPAGLRAVRAVAPEPWPTWAEATGGGAARSWIFQANPALWDLEGALAALPEFAWLVKQQRHNIHVGDTVYLWESGARAGVVAVATVVTEPAEIANDESAARFDRDPEAFAGPRLRVRLRIERVLPERLPRQRLLDHPVLKELAFLRAPQGTNFALAPEQAAALRTLVDARRAPRVVKIAPGEQARYWDDCLAGDFVCVSWDEVGDLRQYAGREALRPAFRAHFPYNGHEAAVSKKVNELWTLRELTPGDRVVANRGTAEVLGVGTVVEPGYEWRPERPEYRHTVHVAWDTTVAGPIPPQPAWATTTVAPVPPELYRLITGQGAIEGDSMPPVPPPPAAYDRLLGALADRGLYFAPEVVSNYLLALQTKRFVILTGISGTGKTQLALAVARHFRSTARVPQASAPPDALLLTVAPYMRKYWRVVIPAALIATMILPDADPATNGRRIVVHYPEGQASLTLSNDPTRNVSAILFKGAFRTWFEQRLQVGDTFLLEAVDQGDGQAHAVRFALPVGTAPTVPVENARVVAVRPDWTDGRGLLGYYNPLTAHYTLTPFLRLLLDAAGEVERAAREHRPPQPFFAILDEMNLARVEHYFSDFLSALESGEALDLHADPRLEEGESEDAVPVPRWLPIPPNLYFTGTVNVDETTYMFSPKVLDRAFTIELNQVDLVGFGAVAAPPPPAGLAPLRLPDFPGGFAHYRPPHSADWAAFGDLLAGDLRRVVVELHQLLATDGRHFGYRVANEIARFVTLAAEQAGREVGTLWTALDLAILEKVLPKFHGTQQELEALLVALFAFATGGARDVTNGADPGPEERWQLRGGLLIAVDAEADTPPRLPRTAAKLWAMLRRLRQQGFTSFIE